jgi:hypothetical protein
VGVARSATPRGRRVPVQERATTRSSGTSSGRSCSAAGAGRATCSGPKRSGQSSSPGSLLGSSARRTVARARIRRAGRGASCRLGEGCRTIAFVDALADHHHRSAAWIVSRVLLVPSHQSSPLPRSVSEEASSIFCGPSHTIRSAPSPVADHRPRSRSGQRRVVLEAVLGLLVARQPEHGSHRCRYQGDSSSRRSARCRASTGQASRERSHRSVRRAARRDTAPVGALFSKNISNWSEPSRARPGPPPPARRRRRLKPRSTPPRRPRRAGAPGRRCCARFRRISGITHRPGLTQCVQKHCGPATVGCPRCPTRVLHRTHDRAPYGRGRCRHGGLPRLWRPRRNWPWPRRRDSRQP